MINFDNILKGFLDKDGKLKLWPAKQDKKLAAIKYLATKFAVNREYTEKEVNEILRANHTFNDHQLLRRELFEKGFLDRTLNGAKYWKSSKNPAA